MDIGIYTIYPMVALFGRPNGIMASVTTCEVPVRDGRFDKLSDRSGELSDCGGRSSDLSDRLCDQKADAEPVEASNQWKRVDLQGSVVFEYEGMSASVIYSKITDSRLCTEISCDGGILSLDQIHICRHAEMTRRGVPTSGRSAGPQAEDISVPVDADEYLCEFREFIDVLESGRLESSVNSLKTSLVTAEILDEIRRQAGVVFPTDQ